MLPITAVRLFFPQAMTRAIDTIRLMGSSGLILTPTEKDLVHPDLREDLTRYLRGREMSAEERLRIMKLAWDIVGTEFGGRQFMYEWFFAGDPFGSRIVYYSTRSRAECEAMARRLLDSTRTRTA
jgi:aromatic ring hydroxylase